MSNGNIYQNNYFSAQKNELIKINANRGRTEDILFDHKVEESFTKSFKRVDAASERTKQAVQEFLVRKIDMKDAF